MFDNNYINISNIFKAINIQQATLFAHIDSLTWLPAFKEEPTFGAILTGMKIAFGFGAIHALAPEQLAPVLSLISGLTVGSVGFWLLMRRLSPQDEHHL
ncbi:MAG: hypothetical protein Kow0049_12000 [Stanieria sp.]